MGRRTVRKAENDTGALSCETCQTLPATLELILNNILDIKRTVEEQRNETASLRKENQELRDILSQIRTQRTSNDGRKKQDVAEKNHKLVLTDSVLGYVDSRKLVNTDFTAVPGAKISNVKEMITNKHHGSSYDSITLHVATNDLNALEDATKLDDVIEEYKSLINETKTLTERIIVSSVCPRLDTTGELVQPFNAALEALCDDTECTFINNTSSFTLADGTPNDGYIWQKGPHLTRPGVNRLIQNLKIAVRPGETDVTRSNGQNRGTPPTPARPITRDLRQNCKNTDDVVIFQDGCRQCNERGHTIDTCHHYEAVKCGTCRMRGHKSKHHRRT